MTGEHAEDAIRTRLPMGADRAVRICEDGLPELDPVATNARRRSIDRTQGGPVPGDFSQPLSSARCASSACRLARRVAAVLNQHGPDGERGVTKQVQNCHSLLAGI